MRRPTEARENAAIKGLCEALAIYDGAPANSVERPDGGGTADGCDAIIVRRGVRVAVEHTTVYQAPQKPHQIKKLKAMTPTIQAILRAAYPRARIHVMVELERVTSGWHGIAEKIGSACVVALRGTDGKQRLQVNPSGVEARVAVDWNPHWEHGGVCAVHPAVWDREPDDDTRADILRALSRKQQKLRAYREAGLPTVLLLECTEPWIPWHFRARCSEVIAAADASALDDVFLAHTGWGRVRIMPVLLAGKCPVPIEAVERFDEIYDALNEDEPDANEGD